RVRAQTSASKELPPPRRVRAPAGTRVIFVRHGHVHNPGDIIYGRMPRMRLSPRGHEDMERTAHILAREPVAAVFTSPLLRAREYTARVTRLLPGTPVYRTVCLVEVRTSGQVESNKVQDYIQVFSLFVLLECRVDET